METAAYFILILSILLQIAATVLALRLVWITEKIGAWVLVAVGITLMTARRGHTLYTIASPGVWLPPWPPKSSPLISSTFLLLGLTLIGPLFLGLKRRSDESLMQSEEKYRLLAMTVPAVVFKGYIDGTLDLFDDKVNEVVGYEKELFNSRRLKWTDLILPEDQEEAKAAFLKALQGNRFYVREYRVKSKDGQARLDSGAQSDRFKRARAKSITSAGSFLILPIAGWPRRPCEIPKRN